MREMAVIRVPAWEARLPTVDERTGKPCSRTYGPAAIRQDPEGAANFRGRRAPFTASREGQRGDGQQRAGIQNARCYAAPTELRPPLADLRKAAQPSLPSTRALVNQGAKTAK